MIASLFCLQRSKALIKLKPNNCSIMVQPCLLGGNLTLDAVENNNYSNLKSICPNACKYIPRGGTTLCRLTNVKTKKINKKESASQRVFHGNEILAQESGFHCHSLCESQVRFSDEIAG